MLYRRLEDGTVVLASQVKEIKEEVVTKVVPEVVPEVLKPTVAPVAKASVQDKPVVVTKEVLDVKI